MAPVNTTHTDDPESILFAIHGAFQLALVQGASDAAAATVQDVTVDHGRGEIRVAEEFLNRAGVVAVLEEMGRERVSKSVGACRFRNSGREHGLPYRTLQGTLVQKMPAAPTTLTMGGSPSGFVPRSESAR